MVECVWLRAAWSQQKKFHSCLVHNVEFQATDDKAAFLETHRCNARAKKIVLGAKALETSTHPVLFGEDTEPTDICQGKVGDCWLVAAIAAVAEFPHYLEDHVFKTKEP